MCFQHTVTFLKRNTYTLTEIHQIDRKNSHAEFKEETARFSRCSFNYIKQTYFGNTFIAIQITLRYTLLDFTARIEKSLPEV